MTEKVFAQQITGLGGCAYIVGGWVRDRLRGVTPKDKDYAVIGVDQAAFERVFSDSERIGKAFPVYLLEIDGKKCEVAFGRTEKKSGIGYTGFIVDSSRTVTIEEDLYRRDTTINSMAFRLSDGVLLDPFNGLADLRRGLLRPVSKHFADDPVRALRAARQAAEFDFSLTSEAVEQMRLCRNELAQEASQRLLAEMKRALAAPRPSKFFQALAQTKLLETAYPWIYRLIGQTQPKEHHPEGDAFIHTMDVLDKTAALSLSIDARFCALVHDLGKGLTPQNELPQHIGHEERGLVALMDWNQQMTLPRQWIKKATFVIKEHMRVTTMRRPGKIIDFVAALSKNPLELSEFSAVILADSGSLPLPLSRYEALLNAMNHVDCRSISEAFRQEKQHGQLPQMIRAAKIKACEGLLSDERVGL